jgi:hypothetical protein
MAPRAAAPPPPPRLPRLSAALVAAGYDTVPPLATLATLSDAALASVQGFGVRRAGHGIIRWEGAVDVRGLPLDAIVRIAEGAVAVYAPPEGEAPPPAAEGEEADSPARLTVRAPPRGEGLNRAARIALEGVFPPEEGEGEGGEGAWTAEAFEGALRSHSEAMGATFER